MVVDDEETMQSGKYVCTYCIECLLFYVCCSLSHQRCVLASEGAAVCDELTTAGASVIRSEAPSSAPRSLLLLVRLSMQTSWTAHNAQMNASLRVLGWSLWHKHIVKRERRANTDSHVRRNLKTSEALPLLRLWRLQERVDAATFSPLSST